MTETVSLLPPRVDFLLYAGNTATIIFAWDTLPATTGWTATLTTPTLEPLDLDLTVDGDDLNVTIDDPSDYAGKQTKLELALGGQVLIAGHVIVLTSPGIPSTATVHVNTAASVTVAVTVATAIGPDGIDGGTP